MRNLCSKGASECRWRILTLMAVAVAWFIPAPALAQLTPDDIEALRKRGEEEGWTFTIGENSATKYSIEQLCGFIEPAVIDISLVFDPPAAPLGLPSAFDWRDHNGCGPVRNQAGCGSCWAFGAIGTLECAILINEGVSVDLSEQWVVSCTNAGSCAGGWHWKAYQYLKANGEQDPCGDSGAVMEDDFPYEAADVPCECPYPHPYWIDDWGQVGSDYPEINDVKQAILKYGPLSTCVYVNGPFFGYNGGVFNACEDHGVNHVVDIVGWDDSQGSMGVWIIRNSWGPGWGEGGYMRIEYNCSRIGYLTCFVEYPFLDCNGNGVHDAQDIADGISEDCNFNDRPDECDIAYGASPDGNNNGIPDECDTCIMNKLLASEVQAEACFGRAVAIAGGVAVAGAVGVDDNGTDAGAAYVFRYNGLKWVEEAKLLASDGAAGDDFGVSVAADADVIIVGADWDDDNGTDSGSAYVYRYDGSAWVEEAKLLPSDGEPDEAFGHSVAVDGGVAIIGAHRDDDNGEYSGSAYVFRYDGSAWVEEAKLLPAGGSASDVFGWSVDISGGVAIGSASWDDEVGVNAGAAYIFRYDGSSWLEDAKLTASDGEAEDFFGWCVSISSDAAIVGASYSDDFGTKSGSAYIYRYDPDAAGWVESKILPTDGTASDRFGHAVSIDGDAAVVGAFGDGDSGGNSGSAYAFVYDGSQWIQQVKFLAVDGAEQDKFGQAVAVSGDAAIIGACWDDDGATDNGSAYIFAGLLGLDCNSNGELDACDIVAGVSVDCNANLVPDDCDLNDGISEDCNLNGIPDECDIAGGVSEDCNANGVPDDCDIDNGVSDDENTNGIPDECECLGDLNSDMKVNIDDLFAVLGAWGTCDECPEDLNFDGVVNIDDVFIVLGAWGPCE
ncbi:MAG: hypothetical protein JSV91_11645 [Phycisphaerales bacterium]|nr:MAG: hypothetical protein JSV91_11645 [Phycisphaerales bacterium]